MISKLLSAGAIALGVASFVTAAHATGRVDKDGGFYATPIQHGAPRDLPGEQLIPGANLAVDVIDGVARPLVVDPIQVAGASLADPSPAPAAAPKPGKHAGGRRHHAAHKHHHKKH